MRTRVTFLLLLSAILLVGCAPAKATERSITVPGHGEVSVTPDVVSVTLGVNTRDANIDTAVRENNRIAADILQAARRIGVAESDLQTSYFSVSPQPAYDQFGVVVDSVTYIVDNNLTVRLRQVSRLSDLLQASVDAGATTIYGVTFSVADASAAENEARNKAMADALNRAAQIAVDAGVVLGNPIMISTGVTLPPQPYYYAPAYGMGGGGGGPPVSTGTNTVAVDVTVSYSIR